MKCRHPLPQTPLPLLDYLAVPSLVTAHPAMPRAQVVAFTKAMNFGSMALMDLMTEAVFLR